MLRLQEDLELTRRSYEQQLSVLTEHMSSLNQQVVDRTPDDPAKRGSPARSTPLRTPALSSLFSSKKK